MRFTKVFFLTGLACLTADAAAHSDILLRADGGQVVVGAAEDLSGEEGGPFYHLDEKVFEGVFLNPTMPTPPFGYDFERTEPGFFSAPGLPEGDDLPANADIALSLSSFSIGAANDLAYYWDGTGEVDFQPLSITQPGVNFAFGPASFASTDANSAVDDHPLFGLTSGAADGVYLVSPVVSVAGLADSDPFYMVWLANSVLVDDVTAEELEGALEAYEEGGPEPIVGGVNFAFFEEAVEYVGAIPEPSTALLAMLAASLVGVTRRR
ncbi:PEP-CTERM sorting domain-containing protein [Botrimarina mediterranea]|uniref:PEP-CTERM sorting domain-containing protein n=1 Tax=Botrimarina mediterranea TaxID=2528022 RepID=UPI00118A5C6F|nr:hypothetical protein K2D_34700 [Planctomycetes bacterium K2D]